MSLLNTLTALIHQQLCTQRLLPRQVEDQLLTNHVQTEDALPAFMAQTLPAMDETELDLLLSAAFTPGQPEKAACCAILQAEGLASSDRPLLTHQVLDLVPITPFLTSNQTLCPLTVPEVCIERYVRLLPLYAPLPNAIYPLLAAHITPQDAPVFNLLARDGVWQMRTGLLTALLPAIAKAPNPVDVMTQITGFVHTYRPKTLTEMATQLESYIRSCESDLMRTHEMSYHDDRLIEKYALHGEGNTAQMEAHHRTNFIALMDKGRMMLDVLKGVPAHAA
jgi:hypothetical protein